MPLFSGSYEGASFFELLRHDFPHLLPFQHLHHVPQFAASELRLTEAVPFATTVLALRCADGVVMAGDRQATEGFEISSRRIEKVYKADDYSVIAMAGAAGLFATFDGSGVYGDGVGAADHHRDPGGADFRARAGCRLAVLLRFHGRSPAGAGCIGRRDDPGRHPGSGAETNWRCETSIQIAREL